MVPDRTRRALSIGHVDFFLRRLLHDENRKILAKYSLKTARSRADSLPCLFQQNQWLFHIDLDELYRFHWLFFSVGPPFMEKTPNYCEKTAKNGEILNKTSPDSFLRLFQQNQAWFQIEIDELYPLQFSISSVEPPSMTKNAKYLQKNH